MFESIFEKMPTLNNEWVSDLQFRTLNIWNITSVENAIVWAYLKSGRYTLKIANVPIIIVMLTKTILLIILADNRFSFGFLGGLCIISGSEGSMPKARAGSPSVTRFIHNIWIASKGSALWKNTLSRMAAKIVSISPKLELSRYSTNFLMLLYMPRPSSTALTIEVKLSSISIISEASFATSVPVIPIAMPMSAFLSAGASLTPSPVIAIMWPFALNASIIFDLC